MIFEYKFDELAVQIGNVERASQTDPKLTIKEPFWTGNFTGRAMIDFDQRNARFEVIDLYLEGGAGLRQCENGLEPYDPMYRMIEHALVNKRNREITATYEDKFWDSDAPRIDPNDEHRTHPGTL